MVSKKEKRRLQAGAKRREKLKELELVKAQSALAVEMRLAKKAQEIKKLLKNAHHDGLDDIGVEARLLALSFFYQTHRPADMVELVSTGDQDSNEQKLLAQYGLWAHAGQENWNSAVTFAEKLYLKDEGEDDEQGVMSPDPLREDELLMLAIHAFANTDQHVQLATEMLLEQDLGATDALEALNVVLRSHLRTGNVQECKILLKKGKQCSLLNEESYEIALAAAAKTGDLELMRQALGFDQQSAEGTLKSFIKDKPVHVMTQLLETFSIAAELGEELPDDLQEAALEALQVLLKQGSSIAPNTLSYILVSLDDDDEDALETIVQCLIRSGKTHEGWYDPLSVPAKVKIFPDLVRAKGSSGDAWKILSSLVTIDKRDGTLSEGSKQFLRKQDLSFCLAAFAFAVDRKHFKNSISPGGIGEA
eukprot:Sro129_g061560.2  (420) ;mRNA; f:52949-54306